MTGLAFGPLIEARSVDHDLAIGRQRNIGAIHGARRGALEIDAFAVVAAAVARALEFIFAGFPVGSAAEMRAARVDDEDSIGGAVDPDAIFLLPLGVHAERVIGGIADLENGGRLEECARKKEAQESDEPGAEKTGDRAPHQAATARVDFALVWTDGGYARSARGFGGANRRSADIAGGVCLTCRGLRRIRFRLIRSIVRARHPIPPGK